MNRSILIIIFLFHLFAQATAAELDYIWPTDASQLFTSSFAESRGNRFHAGVDVKTWGMTGFPIYAIRDGNISRILVSPFGYGRALYLTLDTGEIVVYGHLDKFSDDIAAYVKSEQKKNNSYDVQLYPDSARFPVKQGDVIALSGDSGVGYPHLHFEMRDAASNPINPLLKGYKVFDAIAPRITKILLQPLDALSSVDGDCKPKLFWPTAVGTNQYEMGPAIIVSGRIGFGVDTFDQMDGVDNSFGTFRNELFIDDQLLFAAQYEKFSYNLNNHFNLDRDYRQRAFGNGYIYNLFRDFGNKLWFYSSREVYAGVADFVKSGGEGSLAGEIVEIPPGVSPLVGGAHTFKISVQDFWGNRSTVSGRLVVDGEQQPAPPALPADTIYGPVLPTLLVADSVQAPPRDIDMQVQFYDRYIRIQLSANIPISGMPLVSGWLCSGKTYSVPLVARSNSYIGAWPLSGCAQGPLPLSITYVTAGDTLEQSEWIDFTTVLRGQRKTVATEDGLCKVEFTESSLFKDLFVRTEVSPPVSGPYDLVGNFYRILPHDVALNQGAVISLVYPPDDSLPGKLGIYIKAGDSMRFVDNDRKSAERLISARVSAFGTFALVRDVEPPIIFSLSPAEGAHLSTATPQLRSTFKDELSGIAGEASRLLRLDGKKVIAEYDPEAMAIFYTPEDSLAKGEHRVEIILQDRCGNSARKMNKFFID
ncbi:M23 family metallopeptidase [candidate division KSB1 bacterium]|nr:M23 family metallopeptidase [candidate division KSB1 bacterium]RQW11015.1 MAG: M23 family metallopeptidase [candidate division KSB1 bacterium]